MIKDLDMKRQMILDSPDGLKDISRIFIKERGRYGKSQNQKKL